MARYGELAKPAGAVTIRLSAPVGQTDDDLGLLCLRIPVVSRPMCKRRTEGGASVFHALRRVCAEYGAPTHGAR